MSDDAILRNTQATLTQKFYSGESLTNATGSVLVTIVGDCGGTIVAAGTATNAGTGIYTYDVAPQTDLDLLTATWTGTFGGVSQSLGSRVEVQGAYHVSIADIRAITTLANTSTYPTARLVEVRRWWERISEAYCGVAFVPRWGHVTFDGDDTNWAMLADLRPRTVTSATVGGTAVADLSEWYVYDTGKVVRDDGSNFPSGVGGAGRVDICYEHGYDAPPADVWEAALIAIEERALGAKTGVPARAEQLTAEFATIQLGTLPPLVVRTLNEHVERAVYVG